jgi:hypothetical protein
MRGRPPNWTEPTEETSLVDYILVSWCHFLDGVIFANDWSIMSESS